MKKFYFTILIGIFITILSVRAQENNDTIAKIDHLFSNWNNQTPGASLTIYKNNQIKYHKAYGMADLEHQVKNTTQTIFEAGSVSKQFTAAAILFLASEGKIQLNDDVREYIPELPVYDKVITIKNLLHHTSGLRDWGSVASIGGWPRTTRVYNNDYALDYIFRQKSLNYSPGKEYSYSNSNYILLVAIVERVSDQSLPEFTHNRFFGPLGMNNTKWRSNFREIVPGRAIGYNKTKGDYFTTMPFENTYGHAALLTTTEDLIIWNESWLSNEIGGPELSELRTEKGILSNGNEISYAAAVRIKEINGIEEISHSGSTAGYRAWLSYYPKINLSVAYLSNDGSISPATIGSKIAEIYLGKEKQELFDYQIQNLPEDELYQKEGLYRNSNRNDFIELSVKDGSLYFKTEKLKAISLDTLIDKDGIFIFKADQLIVKKFTDPQDSTTYNMIDNSLPTGDLFEQYSGNYSSEEAVALIKIEKVEESLYAIITPSTKEKLTPYFRDSFQEGNKLYEFVRDNKKNVIGLYISISRAENIFFKKID